MEQKHKDLIRENFSKILELTHLDTLLPKLEAKRIFPEELIEEYKLENLTSTKKKQKIFLDIQKRGPDAFRKLLDACRETGHYDLFRLLNKDNEFRSDTDGINCTKQDTAVNNREIDYPHQNDITQGAKPFQHRDFSMNINASAIDLENTLNANVADTVNLAIVPKRIKVKLANEFMDNPHNKDITPYSMRGRKRGALFMINNKKFLDNKHDPRNGAEIDEANLKSLFSQFGFEIFSYSDQTYVDMVRKIDSFSKDPILNEVDCCFVIIMSHGVEGSSPEDTRIVTYDDVAISTFHVINKFNNSHCPLLQQKPKIIIFQMCRGNLVDHGSKFYTQSDGLNIQKPRMQVATDMCICYTAYPGNLTQNKERSNENSIQSCISTTIESVSKCLGYKSFRDPNTGSWFIETLCDVFMERACDTDILQMLQLVDDKVSRKRTGDGDMQVTSIQHYRFRPCYLNPGLQQTET